MALKISRILHAGYAFECGDTKIAFDPVFENPFSRNCHAFPNVQFDLEQIRQIRFDAVFISHFHDDHCSLESLDLLDRKTPIYLYCVFEELFSLIRELGFINVHSLKLDTPIQIGALEIIPRRALDAEVDSLFQVKVSGLNVLNVVDSWIDDATLNQLVDLGPWDLVLWPFQTMLETDVLAPSRAPVAIRELPSEWLEQIKALNPKYIVPSACQFIQEPWSWYNQRMFPITYQQFQKEIESALPQTQVVRLNPSRSFVLDKNSLHASPGLSWVQPVGNQELDFEYDASLQPTPTSEIAQHFEALTAEQTEYVLEYCRSGLIQKYRSLDAPSEIYFDKPRVWSLSVFDHTGDVQTFLYKVKCENIERVGDTNDRPSWTTEIPVAKLYAALELGESLTSLYMRINDVVFEPAIEKEIQYADIVEDPLIRCLFNGDFGSYQKAQLKRIKARANELSKS
ncbi:hypothetical protein D3C87_1227120 [compost metagenome]